MSTVRLDFFLDPAERLTEQERALMTGMLADLLGGIADEIRAALPSGWGPANDGDGQHLVRQLISAGLLDVDELIAILLRRADEERIGSAVRARSATSSAFLQALIADPNDDVAAAAMALILARGRRRDRLGQPRVEFDDLPAWMALALAQSVAAALRWSLPPSERTVEADSALAGAAGDLMARHDGAKALEAVTASLVHALAEAGKLDERLIEAAVEEGDLSFASEALAHRAGMNGYDAWEHLLDGAHGGFVLLLRVAGASRDLAARLLAAIGDLLGIGDIAQEIGRFEALDDAQAEKARQMLALDPSYRDALAALGGARG